MLTEKALGIKQALTEVKVDKGGINRSCEKLEDDGVWRGLREGEDDWGGRPNN